MRRVIAFRCAVLLFCLGIFCLAQSHAQVPMTGAGLGAPASAPSCSFPTLSSPPVGRWNALNITTSSGNVTGATDLSSGGHNLTVTGTVPYHATGYNGGPAFGFTASPGGALSASGIAMGTAATGYAFFVGQMLTGTTSNGGAVVYGVGAGNDFNGANSEAMFTRNSGTNNINWAGTVYNGNNFNLSLATNSRIGVNVQGPTDGTAVVFLNNVSQKTPGTNTVFANGGTIVIGGRYLSGAVDTTNGWEGPITEVVVGSGTLSGTDLNNLDSYFTCQWGT